MNLKDIPEIREQFKALDNKERQVRDKIKRGEAEIEERRMYRSYPELNKILKEREAIAIKYFGRDLLEGYDDWEMDPQGILDLIEHFLKKPKEDSVS